MPAHALRCPAGFWKWFFTGNGDCGTVSGGFGVFPTFGLQALDWTWNFDFSQVSAVRCRKNKGPPRGTPRTS